MRVEKYIVDWRRPIIILDNMKMIVMKPPVSENASGIVITFLLVFLYELSNKIEK